MKTKDQKYRVLAAATGINFLAGLLYIWSIVSKGLVEQYHWTSTQASLPYTVATISFVLAMALMGRFQDKRGPKICAILAGALIGTGMILSSLTTDPFVFVLTFGVITGAGIGLSSLATTPPALKWFPPEKKGLITGIVVGGIAFASVVYSPLMHDLIDRYGISTSMLIIGIGVLVLMILLAQLMTNPPAGYDNGDKGGAQATSAINYRVRETVKSLEFYKIWFMLGLSSTAGLMIIGHVAGIAKTQAGWEAGFLLVILLAVFNVLGRILGGYLSDKVGRVRYLRIVFIIQAVNMVLFRFYGSVPLLCVGAGVAGLCYGSVFSVFPATTADYFGLENFGANYGVVFTAWGFGGIVGPMTAAAVFDAESNYNLAYVFACALLLIAFGISFTLKRPKQIKEV
jgi:MFS family permease